jgi:hypothetical protein
VDRTVPRTGSEEIELYIRTYYSLLRSTDEVQIRTLEEAHAGMGSSLHAHAQDPQPDMSAFIYSSLRLPECILETERVILGQSEDVFQQHGYPDIGAWQPVSAKARRRRACTDGRGTLACFITSGADIDDLLPLLTAFQIEWNKLHALMQGEQLRQFLQGAAEEPDGLAVLAHGIGVTLDDLERLRRAWGVSFWRMMRAVAERRMRLKVRLLAGSLNDYRRAIQTWWEQAEAQIPDLLNRPVYFVSSNSHSLVNPLSGYALRHEAELVQFLDRPEHKDLLAEWHDIQTRRVAASRENFLYYVLKKMLDTPAGGEMREQRRQDEMACGIVRVPSRRGFDSEVQVVELSRLQPDRVDPRMDRPDLALLRQSRAYVVNIDYPLGMAAYLILSHIAARVGEIRGVYVMGKAATLNGVIGDVMIPAVVHDEQSQNTFLFDNCFSAGNVGDTLVFGTVLDQQKTVSVRGTFLQTPRYMDVFYREGYTDIEMEAGPYLSAVYEMYRPKRYPSNEIIDLHGVPFDLGILHYASDTPLSKGKNLGAGSLSYFGMDPTYTTSLAILRRIVDVEIRRLQGGAPG